MSTLPLLGAAMTVAELEGLQDFILSRDRDLELQDFCELGALDADWKPAAERAKALLSGYKGRLGIHGPFWGFTICVAPRKSQISRPCCIRRVTTF